MFIINLSVGVVTILECFRNGGVGESDGMFKIHNVRWRQRSLFKAASLPVNTDGNWAKKLRAENICKGKQY